MHLYLNGIQCIHQWTVVYVLEPISPTRLKLCPGKKFGHTLNELHGVCHCYQLLYLCCHLGECLVLTSCNSHECVHLTVTTLVKTLFGRICLKLLTMVLLLVSGILYKRISLGIYLCISLAIFVVIAMFPKFRDSGENRGPHFSPDKLHRAVHNELVHANSINIPCHLRIPHIFHQTWKTKNAGWGRIALLPFWALFWGQKSLLKRDFWKIPFLPLEIPLSALF